MTAVTDSYKDAVELVLGSNRDGHYNAITGDVGMGRFEPWSYSPEHIRV